VTVALFVPCYIDQLYPRVAVAALEVLERLGVSVAVPEGAACCGQPAANAGFAREGEPTLHRFIDTFASYEHVVVLSGSCAMHVRAHASEVGGDGARVAARTTEFCAFLHDVIGIERVAALGAASDLRVGVHIGCHGLRGLGLARPSEIQAPPFNKVRALLETVRGLELVTLARPDECCGFGGTFAVAEPAISTKMGRDRLRDYVASHAEAIVSTDMSCLMHLDGLAGRDGIALPMMHVAELLSPRTSASAPDPSAGARAARSVTR
jgi:L-lactate dehydrogenase complex protein LldE